MARVICAVEAVVATPQFRDAALAWAPDIAFHDPGSPGGGFAPVFTEMP